MAFCRDIPIPILIPGISEISHSGFFGDFQSPISIFGMSGFYARNFSGSSEVFKSGSRSRSPGFLAKNKKYRSRKISIPEPSLIYMIVFHITNTICVQLCIFPMLQVSSGRENARNAV